MKKITILSKSEMPNSSEIEGLKDFDKLHNQYIKNPLNGNNAGGNTTWIYGISTASIALLIAIYFFNFTNNSTKQEVVFASHEVVDTSIYKQAYHAPFPQYDIPFEVFYIDTRNAHHLISLKGSKIEIPANCFVDSFGGAISGTVEIHFREFHRSFDIYLAGIPMATDSDSSKPSFLESAGMFEIKGFKDGAPIYFGENQLLNIELTSFNQDENFGYYNFKPEEDVWQYQADAEVVLIKNNNSPKNILNTVLDNPPDESIIIKNDDEIAEKESNQDEKAKEFLFQVSVDDKKFPEFGKQQLQTFRVRLDRSKFDPKYYYVEWDSVILEEGTGNNEYLLRLCKNEKVVNVMANPVAVSDSSKLQRKVPRSMPNKERDIHYTKAEKLSRTNELLASFTAFDGQNIVYRRTSISSFGLHNFDRVRPRLKNESIVAFRDKNGNAINHKNLYLVERGAVGAFDFGPSNELLYNKESANVIWIVDGSGRIGIPELFPKGKKLKNNVIIDVEMYETPEGIARLFEQFYPEKS